MTEPSASSTRILRLTPKDAETILFARALESTSRDAWPQEKLRALSRDARSFAGDLATPEDFLLTRAKLLIARAKDENAGLTIPSLPSAPTMALKGTASIVIFLGFFTGAVADQLTSSGATLNLLSPPYLGILLWNAVVMLIALISFFRAGSMDSGLSFVAARSLSALPRFRIRMKPYASEFLKCWMTLKVPELAWRFRAVLHLAALAFGAGLTMSLLVRGIGTAYSAGWESTWFADRPDIIAKLLNALYGWLPSFLPGISALPGDEALSAMNLAAGGSAPGADWLARMIWSLFILIILPRAVFAAACLWRAGKEARLLRVPLDAGDLDRLLQDGKPRTIKNFVVTDASDRTLPEIDSHACKLIVNPWESPDFTTLSDAGISPGDRVLLVLDPTATPEDEVHGALIHALTMRTPNVELSLDFSQLTMRFSETPERLQSRRALWEHFASENGVPLRITGLAPAA